MKFLAANFPGNSRTKSNEKVHQTFAAFFISLLEIYGENVHPNFALGDSGHKVLDTMALEPPKRYRTRRLRVPTCVWLRDRAR